MFSLIPLALVSVQAGSTQVEWRSVDLEPGRTVRYGLIAERDRPEEEPRPLLVALAPVLSGDVGLEATLAASWLAKAAAEGWLIAGVGLVEPIGSAVERVTAVADQLGREFIVEGRPHLWAAADHSLDGLRMALAAPVAYASAIILDSPAPTFADLDGSLDGLDARIVVRFSSGGNGATMDAAWRHALDRLNAAGATVDSDGTDPFLTPPDLLSDALANSRGHESARWQVENEVRATLDAFHAAAAKADGATYFDLLAADAVYLGTDATERWTKDQFRAFAEPYFASGRGWTYVATERHVQVARGSDVAWFDERLQNDKYGETRGSGVLRRSGGRWRIVQYNLAFPVPNELSLDLVARIRAIRAPRGK